MSNIICQDCWRYAALRCADKPAAAFGYYEQLHAECHGGAR